MFVQPDPAQPQILQNLGDDYQTGKKKENTGRGERKAIKELCKDKKIKILQVDKGNTTVVLNAEDYDKKKCMT